MSIAERLLEIKARIKPGVTLVAVSKTKPFEMVQAAFDAGQRDFGENYVEEIVEKAQRLPQANWHFIGHLQSNKIPHLKKVPNLTVHSVDSLALAQKLAKALPGLRVFLQVNVSREQTKSGFDEDELRAALPAIQKLDLQIMGLMCIGEPEQSARDFQHMNTLRAQLLPDAQLSMGMSADWELAQEMGASFVRVGSSIFGERAHKHQPTMQIDNIEADVKETAQPRTEEAQAAIQ